MTGPLNNKNRYDKNWTDPMVKEEENNNDKVKEFKLLFKFYIKKQVKNQFISKEIN